MNLIVFDLEWNMGNAPKTFNYHGAELTLRGEIIQIGAVRVEVIMKRINFERIEIFVDIDKTRCSVENYKKDFANIIYQLGRGIEAHALAFKIFNSNGEIEYNDEECNMIKEYASLCSPAFIDAINKLLLE